MGSPRHVPRSPKHQDSRSTSQPTLSPGLSRDLTSIPPHTLHELPRDSQVSRPKTSWDCRQDPSKDLSRCPRFLNRLPQALPQEVDQECFPQDFERLPDDFVTLPRSSPRHSPENLLRSWPGPPKHVPTSPKHLDQPPQRLIREVAQECTEGFAQPSQGRCKTFQRGPNG